MSNQQLFLLLLQSEEPEEIQFLLCDGKELNDVTRDAISEGYTVTGTIPFMQDTDDTDWAGTMMKHLFRLKENDLELGLEGAQTISAIVEHIATICYIAGRKGLQLKTEPPVPQPRQEDWSGN